MSSSLFCTEAFFLQNQLGIQTLSSSSYFKLSIQEGIEGGSVLVIFGAGDKDQGFCILEYSFFFS